jgi:hypothetical protein
MREVSNCVNVELLEKPYHQHDGDVTSYNVRSRRRDDEAGDCEPKRKCDVPEPLTSSIGVPGVREGRDDAEEVWRTCEKKSLDVAAIQGLDDRREEVGDGSRRDVAKQHDELS